jgi:hypothetical protein
VRISQCARTDQDNHLQVASQIVGHVFAVLGDKGPTGVSHVPGSHVRKGSTRNADDQRREEVAAVELLRELIVSNAHVLGAEVLATLPPLPEGVLTEQLADVRQVCIAASSAALQQR